MFTYLYVEVVDNTIVACYKSPQGYHYQFIGIAGYCQTEIIDNYIDAKTAYDTLIYY